MRSRDSSITKAIGEILDREKTVHSQARLESLLEERYKIKTGGKRLRRLARLGGAKITMEWRHGDDMASCPFCDKGMKDILSVDLFGKEASIARRCTCGFKAYRGKIPKRYMFSRGKKNAV